MTDEKKLPDGSAAAPEPPPQVPAGEPEVKASGRSSMDPVRRWTLIILAFCVGLIAW
jgi:hypothetical protein